MVKELLKLQKTYINHFFDHVDITSIEEIITHITRCQGVIFFTGVGKSGIVAQKIAVSMTSTGTKSLFISPTDALHGDLGIVGKDDLFIFISKSGESDELLQLLPCIHNRGALTIAFVSNINSRLAKKCNHVLNLPYQRELCPFDLAPTTSTSVQLIFGDILCVALMKKKNFTLNEFASNHPAGRIGKRITYKVKDLMLSGEDLPTCSSSQLLIELLFLLSNKHCGCLLAINNTNHLTGIFTDGDLRRAIAKDHNNALQQPISNFLTLSPKTIHPNAFVYEALQLMESNSKNPITVLPVIENQVLVGLIKLHDIIQKGIY